MSDLTPSPLFRESWLKLQDVRDGFTPIKERWYSWNYWAQHHAPFSFDDWLDENNLRSGNVKAKAHYTDAEVVYDREEGYRYYSAWRGAQAALTEAQDEFDEKFQTAWESRFGGTEGRYAFTNEQIGAEIGMDAEQLRKFAAKRSWYFPRNMKGKK